MDEDLETFIRRYKAKIIDNQKPLQKENFANLNQMTGLDISKQDIGDSLQQKWSLNKHPSSKIPNKVNLFPATSENDGFLSKLGVYEEKRRQLQALRKEEYNELQGKKNNQKRDHPHRHEFECYEAILDRKRQEEKEYRRIHSQSDPLMRDNSPTNIFSDVSNGTPPTHQEQLNENTKTPKSVRLDNNLGTLWIGTELAPEEIQKKKETYRMELEKQMAESKAKKKKKKLDTPSPQQPITTSNAKSNSFDQPPPSISSSSSIIQPSPNPNPPPQNLGFQSLSTFPLMAPAPYYGPSLMPVLMQQPPLPPQIISPIYPPYMGTHQMPYSLNQANGVTSGHFLPQFLKVQDNQSNVSFSNNQNFIQSDASQVSLNSFNVGNIDTIGNQLDQGNNNKQQQQTGVLEAFLYGSEDKNELEKKKRMYQEELKKQMEEDKRKKLKQKEDDEKYERKMQDDVDRYHAQKDALKKNQGTELIPQKDMEDLVKLLNQNQGDKSDAQGQSNHSRGGNGIFGEPMSEEQKKSKMKYQEDLLKQIEDKKKREEEERERKQREEESFLKKVEEDKKRMEEEYEEEKRRKEQEKREAVSVHLLDFPLEDKKREAQVKMEASKRRNTIVKQNISGLNKHHQTPRKINTTPRAGTGKKSPQTPGLKSNRSKENQQQHTGPIPEAAPVLVLLSRMKKELDSRMLNADKLIEQIRHEKNLSSQKRAELISMKSIHDEESLLDKFEIMPVLSSSSKVKFGIGTSNGNTPVMENTSRSNNSDNNSNHIASPVGSYKPQNFNIAPVSPDKSSSQVDRISYKLQVPRRNDSMLEIIDKKCTLFDILMSWKFPRCSGMYMLSNNDEKEERTKGDPDNSNSLGDRPSNMSQNSQNVPYRQDSILDVIHPLNSPKIVSKSSSFPIVTLKQDKSVNTSIHMDEVPTKGKDESHGSSPFSNESNQMGSSTSAKDDDDDDEDELFERLVRKKKEVDTKLKKALSKLEKISTDADLMDKLNTKSSLLSFFEAENMTDDECTKGINLIDKFKEIDQRPFSVHSLDPEELMRQNEERLRRLKIITDQILSKDNEQVLLTPRGENAECFSWLGETEA